MAIKELLISDNAAITEIDQWQRKREGILDNIHTLFSSRSVFMDKPTMS